MSRLLWVRGGFGNVGVCHHPRFARCRAGIFRELIDRRIFRSHAEARMAVFRYIEGWYNPRRRHSALGYLSPMNFEAEYRAAASGPALAVAGRPGHPTLAGTAGLYSAAPQRKLLTPPGEGRDEATVPQFSPVH